MKVRFSVFGQRRRIFTDAEEAHWTSFYRFEVNEERKAHLKIEEPVRFHRHYLLPWAYDSGQNTGSRDDDDERNTWFQTDNKYKWNTFVSRRVQCMVTTRPYSLKDSRPAKR